MGWSFLQKKEVKKNRFFQSVFEKLLNFFNFYKNTNFKCVTY